MKKFILTAALLAAFAAPAMADDVYEATIVIKDHKFEPATLEVPAGKRIKLTVKNQDATPEEFESHDFSREKIIPGNTQAIIFVGPLEAKSYNFFGEFNPATAQGTLVVK